MKFTNQISAYLCSRRHGMIIRQNYKHLLLILPITICLIAGSASSVNATTTSSPPPNEEATVALPKLTELISQASRLQVRYATLEKRIESLVRLDEREKALEQLRKEADHLSVSLEEVKKAKSFSSEGFVALKRESADLQDRAAEVIESLSKATNRVDSWKQDWVQHRNEWAQWRSAYENDVAFPLAEPVFENSQKIIAHALESILKQLELLLDASQEAESTRAHIVSLTAEIRSHLSTLRPDVPVSMVSPRFYTQLREDIFSLLTGDFTRLAAPYREFFAQNGWVIILTAVCCMSIILSIRRHRASLEESKRSRFLCERQTSVGIFTAILVLSFLYRPPVPVAWGFLLLALLAVTTVRILELFIQVTWKRRLVFGFAILMLATRLFLILDLPQSIFRLCIFIAAMSGFAGFLWCSIVSFRTKDSLLLTWLLALGSLLFFGVSVATLSSVSVFPQNFFDRTLRTLFIALAIFLAWRVLYNLFDLFFRRSAFRQIAFLQDRTELVVRRSTLFVMLVIGAYVLALILTMWEVFDSPSQVVSAFLSFGISLGGYQMTIGLVIATLAILYGSFLVSWILQTMLMEGMFQKKQLALGMRMSIARLVHYAVILFGFLVALSACGVDLRNITIIGGALGIGIGFGLQAVVTNFVCGLILLFERPIKVGDTIELGNEMAVIKKVGLRATILQTYDNSEIVVPNSDLVSNQVVNWTLADRRSRLRIPVGVAYGSDVPLVMQTLLACAEENDLVLKNPAPTVLFVRFGESSLDFELRVWVGDFDNRLQVLTELHREIDKRFRSAGIEIPFPQRDLHVRSFR